MGDRMTSAEARREAEKLGGDSTLPGMRWGAAADALAAYEAEDAARRGMPGITGEWWGVLSEGDGDVNVFAGRDEALKVAEEWNRELHLSRVVRLVVVEVAEPEPETPVREVGRSGWWYGWAAGAIRQFRDGVPYGTPINSTTEVAVPPADRALVARLLGEGAPDA